MDKLMQDLLSWIKLANKPIIIGISGHGAAGKTTFAARLINLLSKKGVNYLNTDPYIVDSTIRKCTIIDYIYQNENHRFKMTACHPSAHHLPSLERDIQMIREGKDLYTIHTHYKKSELLASENKVTIVEGMSAAFIEPDLFDLRIYLYTDDETELLRRFSRDVVERGADLSFLKQSHEERRIQYKVFMHPFSQHFDIVIKTAGEQTILEKMVFDFKHNSRFC